MNQVHIKDYFKNHPKFGFGKLNEKLEIG